MSRTFSYFDEWQDVQLTCECGWSGPLRCEDVEPFRTLLEFSCPGCDTALAVVHFPSDEEARAHAADLTGPERAELEKRGRFLEETDLHALKRPDQLPELEGDVLVLHWDFVEQGESPQTVLRRGTTEVWREPAIFEGAERFEAVARILKRRYGARLYDLAPTQESILYLEGDALSASGVIARVREALRE